MLKLIDEEHLKQLRHIYQKSRLYCTLYPALAVLERWYGELAPTQVWHEMEVFCAEYSASGERRSEIRAEVVEAGSFSPMAEQCLFIGDGALKCRETIACGSAIFIGCCPDAASMALLAEKQYQEGNWRDVAYFEPFYLKDYVPTKSTKSLF